MKSDWKFTTGEWIAAVAILLIIVGCYLFYYLYDNNRKMPFDLHAQEAEIKAFILRQQQIEDSIQVQYGSNKRFRYTRYPQHITYGTDTLPKKTKKRLYDIVKLDLNHCDTNEIINIPQFGSKRAAKLVEYREELGGFYSMEQVQEVYILQSIEVGFLSQYFFLNPNDVKKININTAEYTDLIKHPYFDAYLTKTILNYRTKNGNIHSFDELQKITHAYPELMEKLKHYIIF